jgi:SP family sugar:H+ symporter-like MFS transporter
MISNPRPAPYLVNVAPGSAGLQAKVFFIWGSTCFCCLIFTYFCVPEVYMTMFHQ